MTIVTTYTCDKCNHSQVDPKEPRQMWVIGITIKERTLGYSPSFSSSTPRKSADWCRKCVQSLGLLPQEKTKSPTPAPTPTFEDMIRELIQEEMEDI